MERQGIGKVGPYFRVGIESRLPRGSRPVREVPEVTIPRPFVRPRVRYWSDLNALEPLRSFSARDVTQPRRHI